MLSVENVQRLFNSAEVTQQLYIVKWLAPENMGSFPGRWPLENRFSISGTRDGSS